MKKLFLSLLAVMMAVICALAQGRTVTGTVFSASDDEPIIGASVHALGTNAGVLTDMDGKFVLNVPASASKLRIAYVGFDAQEVAIPASGEIIIKLKEVTLLDEVMVVAYGHAKKSEYTGSASVVKADQLEDALVSSATQALTGKVSGVQVISSNGQPGTQPTLRIRGVGSINALSTPLYVVDGVPYNGDISSINTQDIESMTVLKDAASTALYGARGANGVVMITTKKGKVGEAKITFDARWGSNSRALPMYKTITDQRTYMEQIYKSYKNAGLQYYGYTEQQAHEYANANLWSGLGYQTWTAPEGQYFVGDNGKFNPYATPGYSDGQYYYIADDWVKGSFINGLRQEYNFSINGGTDRMQYYLSAGYLGDEGLIYGSHFKRFSSRAAVDYQAKKWLKVGTNVSYVYANSGYPDDQVDASASSGNAFGVAYGIAPVYPMYVRNADGSFAYDTKTGRRIYDYGDGKSTNFVRNYMSMANPTSDLLYNTEEYLMDNLDAKVYATVTPIKDLNITGTVGYSVDNTRSHYMTNGRFGQSQSTGGEVSQGQTRSTNLDIQAIATYYKQFAEVHNFDIMAGYESDEYNVESVSAYGQNIYNPDVPYVDNTIDQKKGYGNAYGLSHRGFIGRLKYNYDGRYFLAFSFRRDASSRFAPEHRWGSFWSASAGWDIAKEKFMAEAKWVDMLKFKASFGQNGNDMLGSSVYYLTAYQDQYRITGADGVWSDGTMVFKGNREITWEKSNSFNIGFDFSFWKSMLSGTIEYYNRQTDDMLFNVPVADSNGYTSVPMNIGSMRNNGFEIELNYTPVNTRNITLDINANVTIPANKVLKLTNTIKNEYDEWISGSRYFKEGGSMYQSYLVEWAGVDQTNGLAMYKAYGPLKDLNGDYLYPALNQAEIDAAKKAGTDIPAGIWAPENVGEYDTYDWSEAYSTNRKSTGNMMPKAYGGFGANLKVYGVDFGFTFSYQLGGKIYDNSYARYMSGGTSSGMGSAYHEDLLKSWTPENTNTDVPALMAESKYKYANSTSTRFLTSSNYLALNNITVGYSFPNKLIKKLGLGELRVYGAAENVALWSKRKGLDPRMGFVSSDNTNYSAVRSISGGVKVSF